MEEALFSTIVKSTGLPEEIVQRELKKIMINKGKNPQDMTLEDLREVLIPLLQNLFCEVSAGENEYIKL